MGFNYRKSIKVMPGVRMTMSKSGVSASVGGRGARITKSTTGRTTKTVGIPGTGLRHISSSSSGTKSRSVSAATSQPKPSRFAPKGEKLLFKALVADDVAAMESVAQNHPDYSLVAAAAAAARHVSGGDLVRARELLSWVFSTNRDPSQDPFFQTYATGTMTVPIAPGVTADLPFNRQAIGLLLAELHQDAGDLDAAIGVVEGLEPTTLAAVSLAELYGSLGRYDEVVDLTDGISNEDDPTALLLVMRGHAFRQLGHMTAARETLREALRSSKRDEMILQRALAERGWAYLGEGKRAQAKKDAERLMSQDRSHPMLAGLLDAIG